MDFNGCDPAHMVASFNSGDVVVYDLETSQQALVLKGQGDSGKKTHTDINSLKDGSTVSQVYLKIIVRCPYWTFVICYINKSELNF